MVCSKLSLTGLYSEYLKRDFNEKIFQLLHWLLRSCTHTLFTVSRKLQEKIKTEFTCFHINVKITYFIWRWRLQCAWTNDSTLVILASLSLDYHWCLPHYTIYVHVNLHVPQTSKIFFHVAHVNNNDKQSYQK